MSRDISKAKQKRKTQRNRDAEIKENNFVFLFSFFSASLCLISLCSLLRRDTLEVEDELFFYFSIHELLDTSVVLEACPTGDDMSHDDVFLKAQEVVCLSCTGGFGENAGRILERCRRDKGIGAKRCL